MTDYSELKTAALAATPGVWVVRADGWTIRAYPDARMACDGIKVVHTCSAHMQGQGANPDIEQQVANQHYIEQAQPSVVLALIAEIEALRKIPSLVANEYSQLLTSQTLSKLKAEKFQQRMNAAMEVDRRMDEVKP